MKGLIRVHTMITFFLCKIYFFIFVSSVSSCFFNGNVGGISLPGKIAVTKHDTVYIYDNSQEPKYKFSTKYEGSNRDGFRWLNKGNNLIGVEYSKNSKGATVGGNLVYLNSEGKKIRIIYKAPVGEIPGYAHLSPNDKFLLFTTDRIGDVAVNPLEGLNRQKSILIMDFNSGKLLKRIGDVGTSLTLEVNESPWMFDENRFLYSISNDKQISVDNGETLTPGTEPTGIYIYDLSTDIKTLVLKDGNYAISSPTDNKFGYITDHAVWIMDLKDSSKLKLFELGLKDRIVNLHWTPDGKYMYIAFYKMSMIGEERVEKLIEIKTGKNVDFRKIGHGFRSYTWK